MFCGSLQLTRFAMPACVRGCTDGRLHQVHGLYPHYPFGSCNPQGVYSVVHASVRAHGWVLGGTQVAFHPQRPGNILLTGDQGGTLNIADVTQRCQDDEGIVVRRCACPDILPLYCTYIGQPNIGPFDGWYTVSSLLQSHQAFACGVKSMVPEQHVQESR
jgi:hypothetical protein